MPLSLLVMAPLSSQLTSPDMGPFMLVAALRTIALLLQTLGEVRAGEGGAQQGALRRLKAERGPYQQELLHELKRD